jgi:hypothetical protein
MDGNRGRNINVKGRIIERGKPHGGMIFASIFFLTRPSRAV